MKTLIIKLGAMGDVIRTTPLLHVLQGDVYWVTRKECIPLLPTWEIKKIIDINKVDELLADENFDLVLSLDDENDGANVATKAKKDTLIGSYIDAGGDLTYTDSSSGWFDMGLISKYGKEIADRRKFENQKTWQEILFGMIGKEFKGEEYILNYKDDAKPIPKLIGIEKRAGKRWLTKIWNRYEELAKLLKSEGYSIRFFQHRENIYDYIKDISECSWIVTGDTLAMHIALALNIPTVAIFTCTSPAEIYDYGRAVKVISPLLKKSFYSREYIPEAADAITLNEVYNTILMLLKKV